MIEKSNNESRKSNLKTRPRTIGEKFSMSFGLLVMWPMMVAAPREEGRGFWRTLGSVVKEIWTGKETIYDEEEG